jgi:hypothetical protein
MCSCVGIFLFSMLRTHHRPPPRSMDHRRERRPPRPPQQRRPAAAAPLPGDGGNAGARGGPDCFFVFFWRTRWYFLFFLETWLHFMFLEHGSSHTIYQTGYELGSAWLIRATKHVQKITLVWGRPSWAQLVSDGIVQLSYQTCPNCCIAYLVIC